MVFFACNGCGEPLKKKIVEKHNYRCRSSQGITCIDCHKIFGDDYLNHTSCISEQEKYGGTNFTPKEMKGQKKQEEWIETLKKVAKELDVEPRFKKILNEAACTPNVPRNKKKLTNYFNNQFRIPQFDAEKLADLVMNKAASIDALKPKVVEETKKENMDKPEELKKRKQEDEEESLSSKKKKKLNENNVEISENKQSKTHMENSMDENQVLEKSKKKKKSKGKDREVSDSVELEHTNIISNGDATQEEKSSKKKKSKTKDNENNEPDEMQTNGKMKEKSKKESTTKSDENKENVVKKDAQKTENSSTHSDEQILETSIGEALEHDESVGPASEFKWKVTIKKALKANDSQMKLKKLEKIVIEEYLNFNGNKSLETEAVKELFKKKINNDKFIIEDKYVKLK